MKSNRTTQCRVLFWIFFALSLVVNIGPLAAYTIVAFLEAGLIIEKVTLCLSVFVVGILSLIAWLNKTTLRSRIWVILLALYICLDSFIVPLLIIAVTQIVDEWFITPLRNYYRGKLSTNKEIDKRWNNAA